MTDYDVPYQCACCGKMTTNYLCGRCAKGQYSNDIAALRSSLAAEEEAIRWTVDILRKRGKGDYTIRGDTDDLADDILKRAGMEEK